MIFTLAGHVDHGKSSLVRALTGVDTDRLQEEKRRGLTIDLGFAYADFDGVRVGFVDVPGHHRFVHNMVAGVAAGQTALLVVAADDGVMPQTREHVTILALNGVDRAVVAISKADRVDAVRCADVERDVRALLDGAHIDALAVVHTAIDRPETVDALRVELGRAARHPAETWSSAPFRLAVDRAFNVRGVGLVVTGTVHTGLVAEGDHVLVAPSGKEARVRSLRAQDRPAARAEVGDRCALNLSGIEVADVGRGDWIVAPDAYAPSRSLVVDLATVADLPHALRQGLRVHVYHATSHSEGRVTLLAGNRLAAGERMLAEIALEGPLNAKRHDRVVLRDHGLDRTVGGGPVVDITTVVRGRRTTERLARLAALAVPTANDAFDRLLALGDVDAEQFRATWNLTRGQFDTLAAARMPVRRTLRRRDVLVDGTRWSAWRDDVVASVDAVHAAEPSAAGVRRDVLARSVTVPARWLDAVVQELVSEAVLVETAGVVARPGRRVRLSDADERLLERIERRLAAVGQPPSIGDLAKEFRMDLARLKSFVQRMHGLRRLVRVSESRALLPAQVARFAALARELAERTPDGFSARELRDASGSGRNLVIEVLEYFDARGFTRRFGEVRRIVGPAPL